MGLVDKLPPTGFGAKYGEFISGLMIGEFTYPNRHNLPVLEVDRIDSVIYNGDLYGLLNRYNINKVYYSMILRLNGFKSSGDYSGELTIFVIR